MPSPVGVNRFYKALFLEERSSRALSPHLFFRGLTKLRGWRRLRAFKRNPANFKRRLSFEKLSFYEFGTLLGQKTISPKSNLDLAWVNKFIAYEHADIDISSYLIRFPQLNEYLERGMIAPFICQIAKAIEKISALSNATDYEINLFLKNELPNTERLTRKAFILELNVCGIKGELSGDNDSQKYRDFIKRFNSPDYRLKFFQEYPVLYRAVVKKLGLWAECTIEFLARLHSDRVLIENVIGVSRVASLKSITISGDTHNNGRSVFVIEFSSQQFLVYKPRSTSIELGFQEYLKFFNTTNPNLNLRCINVLDKDTYGWVEYVPFIEHSTQVESDTYHYRLGFLTAIIYSINGVDIFFENLIASGVDPVVIDLETMFHTSIDVKSGKGPVDSLQLSLYDSIAGIGILPQPNQGATESELFDISVLGVKKDAQAPYKVCGVENFGRSDMRITEISGWINENKASSENNFSHNSKVNFVLDGIKDGLTFILKSKDALGGSSGIVERSFANAKRRLIVRDTKIYGSLQDDETHPDLLRDQLDREWHWDNLWSDILDRPNLSLFIQSELCQLKQGDIPYFSGGINSLSVIGGDGMMMNLSSILSFTPLELVQNKLLSLSQGDIDNQIRIASTILGHEKINVTQPPISPKQEVIENAISIGNFIRQRMDLFDGSLWCDTSVNPAPKAKNVDPVRVAPCDPFLYDGILGLSMFFDDLYRLTKDKDFYNVSNDLVLSVFDEIERSSYYSPSGFAGLSSIVYVVNRGISKGDSSFLAHESRLKNLLLMIETKAAQEEHLDFLLGISGIACALLPYVSRTASKLGISILKSIRTRLTAAGNKILESKEPISGMDYMRGFSHGITGISFALYRLGELFNEEDLTDLAANLLLYEYALVKNGKWTDNHMYGGEELVGWCHGSAGIALALSSMPKILEKNKTIHEYLNKAVANTLVKGSYESRCLCHGTGGNILCLRKSSHQNMLFNELTNQFQSDLLESGFSSMGAAQSMGIGLMTGLTGAGYFLLGANDVNFDYDFLILS